MKDKKRLLGMVLLLMLVVLVTLGIFLSRWGGSGEAPINIFQSSIKETPTIVYGDNSPVSKELPPLNQGGKYIGVYKDGKKVTLRGSLKEINKKLNYLLVAVDKEKRVAVKIMPTTETVVHVGKEEPYFINLMNLSVDDWVEIICKDESCSEAASINVFFAARK